MNLLTGVRTPASVSHMNTNRERVRRYIVIHQGSGRIVATCGGTHAILERVCNRLDGRHSGTYVYDDASEASRYLPQIGGNIALSGRRW